MDRLGEGRIIRISKASGGTTRLGGHAGRSYLAGTKNTGDERVHEMCNTISVRENPNLKLASEILQLGWKGNLKAAGWLGASPSRRRHEVCLPPFDWTNASTSGPRCKRLTGIAFTYYLGQKKRNS